MYKFFITLCALFLLNSATFGQDYTFSAPTATQKKSPPKLKVPPARTPSSPADFKKGVNALNQKSQNALNEQAAQQLNMLKKNSPSATSTPGSDTTTKPAKPASPVIGLPTEEQAPSQMGNDVTTPAPRKLPDGSLAGELPPPPDMNQTAPQSEPQTYTGFPGATQNAAPQPQQPSQQPESSDGGWLKY